MALQIRHTLGEDATLRHEASNALGATADERALAALTCPTSYLARISLLYR